MHGIPKGKIIRDAVHGDIFVEDKFLKIIDTPEFQRMRRIKQLSVANIVFPSADHTRFSHSLGCFYVMKQIIAHFDSIFGKMGIEVSKQDKDIALLAALLHDIGHGPFSHAFEDIHPKGAAQVSHETWTSRIITCHFWCAFQSWSESPDVELSDYCLTILNRQKLLKLNALDNTSTAYHRFKEDFCKLLKKHNYTLVTEDSLAESPFWIEKRFVFSAYKPQKENIWIQTAAGFLVDISQQSKIVQLRDDAADEAVFLSDNERVWINRRILETLPLSNMTEFQKALDELIHNYDIRNTIEIEKKYHFSDEAVFQDVLAYLKTRDDVYSFDKSPAFEQVDSYYDTPDKLVESAKSTLRIRHKDCNYEITIKCPTPVQIKDNGQNERFEFCHPISSNSLSGEEAFIVKHVPSLKDKTSELKNTLTIINKREIINILAKKSEAKFEMAFDHVTYQDDSGHKAYDYQIEIELKSDYIHRVNLKMLTDDLERKVSKLESSTESKYKRGLTKLSVQ